MGEKREGSNKERKSRKKSAHVFIPIPVGSDDSLGSFLKFSNSEITRARKLKQTENKIQTQYKRYNNTHAT